MNTLEFIDKWLVALRSGKYEQGTNALRDAKDGFCCLGVACDLLAKEGKGVWIPDTVDGGPSSAVTGYHFRLRGGRRIVNGLMPPSLARKLKLHLKTEPKDSTEIILASYNDASMPFSQIADFIEKQVRPLHEKENISGAAKI